jgi:predicted DNA-binding protein
MPQFNIRDMPEGSQERLKELVAWTGWTKTQVVLIAIERLWLEVKAERESKNSASSKIEAKTP